MKEKEFVKIYPKEKRKIEIPLYWGVDDEGEVIIDKEGMEDEFEEKLGYIEELLSKDELQRIVAEKIDKIKNEKN